MPDPKRKLSGSASGAAKGGAAGGAGTGAGGTGGGSGSGSGGGEGGAGPWLSREEMEDLSALQLVDLIAGKLPPRHLAMLDLVYLRERVVALEETNDQAREAIEKLDAAVEKLRSPAFRVGTFLAPVAPDLAQVCVGGSEYVCRLDPRVPLSGLQVGQRVLCNEAFAVVNGLGFDRSGPVVRVDEVLSEGRLRIGQEGGLMMQVVVRSALLEKEKLKPGMEVRLDPNQRVALEVVGAGRRVERVVQTVEALPWSAVGGQEEAVQAIRDTIELPFLHRDLFRRFEHTAPKGFLLYGPPGCGKTLLGRATAYNLREQMRVQTGRERPEFFLHVKGPEILNMWVGESERQVRDLFAQCRERAREGALAFLFIDEAESILGTRHGGRFHSMVSTLVPMFCTEMDGIEPLENVVVILASNRADLIDPAILRPGRIDRKIKVRRPDEAGARRIYEIYLSESLPLGEGRAELAAALAERHYARVPENEFLEVAYRSGRRDVLYRGDLASGAVIAAVVERAKSLAIKRAIREAAERAATRAVDASGATAGAATAGGAAKVGEEAGGGTETAWLTRADLLEALELEYRENDLFPSSDTTEDWLKLTDFDPANVVQLGAVRGRSRTGGRAI